MTELGKYEILEEIGRGGFAVVYKARDTTLDRVVALKVLFPQVTDDPRFIQRFQQEARIAANLRHHNIVTVHEVGEQAGQHYLAMTFLPGQTLDKRLAAAEGPLLLEQTVSIVEQVASALDAIHQHGLVHRDVKPTNVIVDDAGQATLLDFGIVRAADGTQLTTTGAVMGTPQYMSPEQAEGEEIDHRSDVYSLGVVAYQMSTGQAPFDAVSPLVVLRLHADKSPPSPRELNPGLPIEVEQALLRALAKKREERYQSAGELSRALREAMEAAERARQREEQMTGLYERLQAAVATQDSGEVMTLGEQIRALDPNYRDAAELVEEAHKHLRRPRRPSMAAWVGGAGAVGLLILIALGAALVPRLRGAISPAPEAPTKTPAEEPTTEPTGATVISARDILTRPADGMVMVYVPGGTFQMGSAEGDPGADDLEFPQHSVTLDGFWIDQAEVTNGQYRRCVEARGCSPPDLSSSSTRDLYYGNSTYDDYPVIYITWQQAANYCMWAKARLPTEAEWEYTARGNDGRVYPWGGSAPDCDKANYSGCVGDTSAVGSYRAGASWCDALDMAGNVWEWVADWWEEYLPGSLGDRGIFLSAQKVVRGGSWYSDPSRVRSAFRGWNPRDNGSHDIGFRCVRDSE